MSLELDPLRFQRGYYRRVEVAIGLALGIHVLVFALAPPYVPRPYRLAETRLRLVGAVSAGAALSEADAPAAPRRGTVPSAPSRAAVRSEQLRVSGSEEAAFPAAGAAWPGASTGPGSAVGSGEGGESPPVYYAFDTPPRILRRVEPAYPASAKAQEAQGTVILNANIDEKGVIQRVWVVSATAPEALVEAAIDALYQFEFAPGSQQGIPVRCTVSVPFRFTLNHQP